MSFILDALRKADSERRQGSPPPPEVRWLDPPAPSASPAPVPAPLPPAAGGRLRWLAAGAALGMALLAAGGGWLGREPPPSAVPRDQPVARPAPVLEPPPAATASLPPPAATPSLPPPMAAPAPDPPPATAAAPVSTRAVAPLPQPAPARDAAASTASPSAASAPVVAGRPGGPGARPAAAADAAAPLVAREDLPADLRRSLPPLVVGGAVFSNDPASRLLILDGQIVREGDRVGTDLVVERIDPRRAVMNRRGERFSISW
jgi:general secretion pathway protein B